MPLEPPKTRWTASVKEISSQGQFVDDEQRNIRHTIIGYYRDVLNFDCGRGVDITVANNIAAERVPVNPHGFIVYLKAHSKSPGAGDITLRVNNDASIVGTITIPGGSTSVVIVVPIAFLRTTEISRISVDCTAVAGSWQWVLVSVIIDPVQEDL
jgi:hypothetical protein